MRRILTAESEAEEVRQKVLPAARMPRNSKFGVAGSCRQAHKPGKAIT